MERKAQSYVDFDISGSDQLDVSMLVSDGVVCMYVNEKMAFTTRMYMSQGSDWGVFGVGTKVKFDNIRAYK